MKTLRKKLNKSSKKTSSSKATKQVALTRHAEKIKEFTSAKCADKLAEVAGLFISDENLKKTTKQFIKSLHGQEIKNTSGI